MSSLPGGSEAVNRRLTSWKEIAAYLQKDIRTVQRWEKKEGLPVHRHVHDSRSSVSVTTAELDAWVLQRTVSGRPSPQAPLPWWKNWRLWLTATVATASIAAMVAWKFPQRKDIALRQLPLPDGLIRAGTPSWDGRFIPYRSAKRGQPELLLYDTKAGQSRLLYRVPENLSATPRMPMGSVASPDGSRVAFMLQAKQGGGELRLMESDGSGDRVLLSDPQYLFYHPCSWSLDGRMLVVVLATYKGANDVGIIDVGTGAYRILHHSDSFPGNRPQISPDGRFVAFTEGGRLYVVPTHGGAPIAVTKGAAEEAVLGWAPDGRLLFQSDRSGKQDVFAVEWDGKAVEPHVLWKDLPMTATAVGTTKQGDLYFARVSNTNSLVTAELVNGHLAADPVALPATRFDFGNRSPDFSPDGLSLAYVSAASEGNDFVLRIRTLANNRERVIRLPMPGVSQIRWYRDGTAILIQGGWGNSTGFYKVAVSAAGSDKTAEVSPVLEGLEPLNAVNPTFSLDGSALYFKAKENPGAVDRLDLATKRRTTVLKVEGDSLRLYTLSPDQKRIAYTVESHRMFTRDLAGGEPQLLLDRLFERPGGPLVWVDSDAILFSRVDSSVLSDHLLQVPLDGSPPYELAETGVIGRMALHPDRRHLVWESYAPGQELSVIEGLLR